MNLLYFNNNKIIIMFSQFIKRHYRTFSTYYTPNGEWVTTKGNARAHFGLTSDLVKKLGKVNSIIIQPYETNERKLGDVLCTIITDEQNYDVKSPCNCKIINLSSNLYTHELDKWLFDIYFPDDIVGITYFLTPTEQR